MKWFFSILLSLSFLFSVAQKIYHSETFVLHLKADSSFIYYPKEASLKSLIAGKYLMRKDSLILTSHQYDGETVIFAIYQLAAFELKLLYAQNEYHNSLSQWLYLHQTFYATLKIKEDYHWLDYANRNYECYTFTSEGYRLSSEYFENGQLEGKQLYFYPDKDNNIQMEANYKKGNLNGKQYYYEALKGHEGKLAMVKKETYRNGKLVKSKMPATPPIFYTHHF